MRTVSRLILAACSMVALMVAAGAPTWIGAQPPVAHDPKMLIGTWESVPTKALPADTTLRWSFLPGGEKAGEGTMKLAAFFDGKKANEVTATYKLEGNLITAWRFQDNDKITQKDTIKKLTPEKLVTETEKGIIIEYKKVK